MNYLLYIHIDFISNMSHLQTSPHLIPSHLKAANKNEIEFMTFHFHIIIIMMSSSSTQSIAHNTMCITQTMELSENYLV